MNSIEVERIEKTVTVIPGHRTENGNELGTFYFNGIPGILARGKDGGTYEYRSFDRKKLSEINLAGWDVCGGSYGRDSVTEFAYVCFESGTVYRLFGGGQGITKHTTLVLDGGAVAKEGVRGITRVAVTEWSKDGINVNVICPLAWTSQLENFKNAYTEAFEKKFTPANGLLW